MVKQHTGHPPRHWFFLWKTPIPHGKIVNSEKSTHLPCSMQVAILVLALTEKDEAMKGGCREALRPVWRPPNTPNHTFFSSFKLPADMVAPDY
jgi:hypothetical protein